jgi:hypothetical protein
MPSRHVFIAVAVILAELGGIILQGRLQVRGIETGGKDHPCTVLSEVYVRQLFGEALTVRELDQVGNQGRVARFRELSDLIKFELPAAL